MESLKPFRNLGGVIRRIFDLQVASTYRGISKYIRQITGNSKYGKVLDVGCGASPYKDLFPSEWIYEGIDISDSDTEFNYHENNVIYYDGVTFPEEDNSIDLVFHSEVMEHVYDTKHFLRECHRVLKHDGSMLITVPFQARYHYIPYDYWRFTPSSLKLLLEEGGFQNIEITPRSRDICVAAYKVVTIGYRLFFSRSWWRMLISIFFAPLWAVNLLIGQMSLHLNLGADEDNLGYIIYCEKR